MLPASTFAEITSNLAALHLEPGTAAQILAAVTLDRRHVGVVHSAGILRGEVA
jgi:hypothetical protein